MSETQYIPRKRIVLGLITAWLVASVLFALNMTLFIGHVGMMDGGYIGMQPHEYIGYFYSAIFFTLIGALPCVVILGGGFFSVMEYARRRDLKAYLGVGLLVAAIMVFFTNKFMPDIFFLGGTVLTVMGAVYVFWLVVACPYCKIKVEEA